MPARRCRCGLASAAVVSHDQVTVSDPEPGGDGDGFIEPTETFSIKERLKNDSGAPLSVVSASLSSLTPFLTIDQPVSAYPAIPIAGTAENTTAFRASTTSAVTCGTTLTMRLDVTTDQGTATPTFSVPTSGPRVDATSADTPMPSRTTPRPASARPSSFPPDWATSSTRT